MNIVGLARALGGPRAGGLSDGHLLECFATRRDEAAFAALLERHGPMVLGVCRRLLGHEQDAEDVFQSTFLLLARKAASVRKQHSVASWLHGAARRLAGRARRAAARRGRREGRAAAAEARPGLEVASRELRAAIDEALAGLPGHYRDALVLCYLEGRTVDGAARELGCPRGTVASRLAQGRKLLRDRLVQRGVSLSAVAVATLLLAGAAPAAVSPALLKSTRLTALAHAATAGKATAAWAALLTLGLALGGATVLRGSLVAPPPTPPVASAPPAAGDGGGRLDLHGDALPAGAVARLGTVRFRREDQATSSLAFAPDGKVLISGRTEKALQLWDVATGKPLHALRHEDRVDAFALSADGKTLATVGFAGLVVWDVGRRKPVREIRAQGLGVVALSLDGKTVASGGKDKAVRLWDVATGKQTGQLLEHKGSLNGLVFTPDGKVLVSADGVSVRLWDVRAGREPRTIKPGGGVERIALSPDGKLLASGGTEYLKDRAHARLRLWDVATGRRVRELEGHEHFVYALAFSRDGKTLASTELIKGGPKIFLWDVGTGKLRRAIDATGWRIDGLAFSPSGTVLASSEPAVHSVIDLWDVKTGKPLRPAGPTGGYKALAFSPDGKLVATGAWLGHAAEGIRIWEASTGRLLRQCEGRHIFFRIAFTPDGKGLCGITGDGMLRVWDASTGKATRTEDTGARHVAAFAFSADGKRLTAVSDGAVTAWDAATGDRLLRRAAKHDFGNVVPLSADGEVVAERKDKDKGLNLWEASTGKELGRLELADPRKTERISEFIAFAPDRRTLAAVTYVGWSLRGRGYEPDECALRLWELATQKEVLRISGIKAWVTAVAFSPDGRTLATAGEGVTQLWDVATGRELLARRGQEGRAGFTALAFSPDGKRLAVGYRDATALIWDLTPGVRRAGAAVKELGARQLNRLWNDLAAEDAAKAHAAAWALVAADKKAIALLKERLLKPAPPPRPADARRVRRLLDDLDSDRPQTREDATKELERINQVEEPLREALAEGVSAEARRRIEGILSRLRARQAPELRRDARAVGVLEAVGTGPAREVLKALARGAPAAPRTQAAKDALMRLSRRP